MSLPTGLLDAAKNYLDITWTDADTDTKLTGILTRGMAYLENIAGDELDYAIEEKPRELLFEYARYVRAGALNEFMKNYLHELKDLQITQEMAADEESDV